jgi:hypothetical protein
MNLYGSGQHRWLIWVLCGAGFLHGPARVAASTAEAEPAFTERASQLLGIYEAVPATALPAADLHAEQDVPLLLTPAGLTAQSAAQLGPDPKDMCQVMGPYRYMARADVKFELLRDAPNKLVMVFEHPAWGHLRTINLDVVHAEGIAKARPLWNGDSVARWNGDRLAIDSIHFTNRTWLNDAGVVNSKQLHLTEELRLVEGGKFLVYRATADDPAMLEKPASYTRYFRRTDSEIQEHGCSLPKLAKAPAGK